MFVYRATASLARHRLARRILHFAYPFGGRVHAGPREFRLAAECGFSSAVTTRLGNIFPESDRVALPRIFGATNAEIELAMTGIVSAFQHRGRRIVRDRALEIQWQQEPQVGQGSERLPPFRSSPSGDTFPRDLAVNRLEIK